MANRCLYLLRRGKAYVVQRDKTHKGIVYVKAFSDGLTYYLEQATEKYGNERLLVNKQMIKTGIQNMPAIKGLESAVTKKQSKTEFFDDLRKAPKVYVQDVYRSCSAMSISDLAEKSNLFDKNTEKTKVGSAQTQADKENRHMSFASKKQNGVERLGKTDYNTSVDLESLSLRFISNRDRLYHNISNVPPLDGYEDVVCHADPYSFGFVDPDTGETLQECDAKAFAEYIRGSGKYNGGAIRLIACEAGKFENGPAQALADEIGQPVLAPTEIVHVSSDGNIIIADDENDARHGVQTGEWRLFRPKKGGE